MTWQSTGIVTAATLSLTVVGIATAQWTVILIGLVVGVVARWAYLMSLQRQLGWKEVRVDLMMFPMNGVLTAQLVDFAGIHDGRLLLASSMFGAASTLAFSAIHRRWLSRVIEPQSDVSILTGTKPKEGAES